MKATNKKNNRVPSLAAVMMALSLSTVWPHSAPAQEQQPADQTMDSVPGMNMESMDMAPAMDHGSMPDASTSSAVRDPHAYADGYDFGEIPRPHLADEHSFASLLVDRLEWLHASDNSSAAYDLQAWYGRDYDRVVLKAEGDVENGELQDGRTELLWGHAVSPFWDAQLGMRYDRGVGPERGWLAFGVQGLAPYRFEVSAAAYVADEYRSALRLDGEYDLLITQRLILQPRFEMDFYGKDDGARALGSGLSDLAAGIRLRYEIQREFAPYLGIKWSGKYGGTADYVRAKGNAVQETRYVAGLRFWF